MADKPQRHPALQLAIFIGIFVGIFFLGNVAGMLLVWVIYGSKTLMALGSLTVTAPHFVSALWIVQIIGTTLPIFAAPVMFATLFANDSRDYLKIGSRFPWLLLAVVLAIMLFSNPLIELLSNINQKMVLPPWLKWMRESEDNAQKVMEAMLKMDNIWEMLMDVLLVGLLTAIVEEFMFRGVLQTILFRWTKNTHAAVWITAILFSAFHIEFFGFLPRLLLGVFFGYFVAWSGSIWTGVWAHFINNATSVIAVYLYQVKVIKTDMNDQHLFNYAGYIISFIIVAILLFAYKRIALKKNLTPEY